MLFLHVSFNIFIAVWGHWTRWGHALRRASHHHWLNVACTRRATVRLLWKMMLILLVGLGIWRSHRSHRTSSCWSVHDLAMLSRLHVDYLLSGVTLL